MNMDIEHQAREETTARRQREKHLHDTMSTRAEAELETAADNETSERAREGETTRRQHDDHLREKMLKRSQAEIGDR
ncbi:hypothetical protein [Myxosarcina sp. GI1(2024)]